MANIKNYTTKISAHQTLGELTSALCQAGATAVLCEFDSAKQPLAISFKINTQHGLAPFRLPSNVDGVFYKLKETNKSVTREHASNVSWRILKNWVDAQLAIIQSGLALPEQVFFPCMQNSDGVTLYERFNDVGMKLLENK
jgi:hypothetical protein